MSVPVPDEPRRRVRTRASRDAPPEEEGSAFERMASSERRLAWASTDSAATMAALARTSRTFAAALADATVDATKCCHVTPTAAELITLVSVMPLPNAHEGDDEVEVTVLRWRLPHADVSVVWWPSHEFIREEADGTITGSGARGVAVGWRAHVYLAAGRKGKLPYRWRPDQRSKSEQFVPEPRDGKPNRRHALAVLFMARLAARRLWKNLWEMDEYWSPERMREVTTKGALIIGRRQRGGHDERHIADLLDPVRSAAGAQVGLLRLHPANVRDVLDVRRRCNASVSDVARRACVALATVRYVAIANARATIGFSNDVLFDGDADSKELFAALATPRMLAPAESPVRDDVTDALLPTLRQLALMLTQRVNSFILFGRDVGVRFYRNRNRINMIVLGGAVTRHEALSESFAGATTDAIVVALQGMLKTWITSQDGAERLVLEAHFGPAKIDPDAPLWRSGTLMSLDKALELDDTRERPMSAATRIEYILKHIDRDLDSPLREAAVMYEAERALEAILALV